MSDTTNFDEHGRFKAGNSVGKLGGRPLGSRQKLATAFCDDVYAAWQAHGASVIERVIAEDPVAYLRIAASILPSKVEVAHDHTLFANAQSFRDAFALALKGIGVETAPKLPRRKLIELEAQFHADE